jgi:Helix-hairpin-helix motif
VPSLLRFSTLTVAVTMLAPTLLARAMPQQATASTDAARARFPAGPGREALFKVCNDCHGPESVLGHLQTKDEWRKTLDEMAANGAQGTDEEWASILAYLNQHYSLIAVNTASAADLASMLDVTDSVAQAIVKQRAATPLKTIADLKRIPGIDGGKIESRKDRLIF